MSDSPPEENKPLLSSQGGKKEDLTRPVPYHAEKTKLPALLKIIVAMAVIALAVFAGVIISQLSDNPEQADAVVSTDNSEPREPISILPLQPEGITVLEKQPDASEPGTAIAIAPVAQGADIASGFAIDIGAAGSYLDLSRKFADLVATNGADNFQRLEPRAVLRETVTGLEARLLIGPFETLEQAEEACGALILPPDTPCIPDTFQGDLIPRE